VRYELYCVQFPVSPSSIKWFVVLLRTHHPPPLFVEKLKDLLAKHLHFSLGNSLMASAYPKEKN
jgi:hypothetical protein